MLKQRILCLKRIFYAKKQCILRKQTLSEGVLNVFWYQLGLLGANDKEEMKVPRVSSKNDPSNDALMQSVAEHFRRFEEEMAKSRVSAPSRNQDVENLSLGRDGREIEKKVDVKRSKTSKKSEKDETDFVKGIVGQVPAKKKPFSSSLMK